MTLSDKIKKSKASVKQLAQLSDVPASTIYNWLAGKSLPRESDEQSIEKVLLVVTNLTKQEIRKLCGGNDSIGNLSDKDLRQALVMATGNKHIKIQGIEEGNKLSQQKDVNAHTGNKKKGINYPHPESQTQEFIHMKDFMKFLNEGQRQMSQLINLHETLIVQNGELIKKIPDAEGGQSHLGKTATGK